MVCVSLCARIANSFFFKQKTAYEIKECDWSSDVCSSDLFEEAMQTTPPIASASAPKAEAVQPSTRKMAEVAIKVAIVMPETGLAELPMSPVMRDETVTNKKPKITTKIEAIRLANIEVLAPGTGLKVRKAHMMAIINTE